MLFCFTAHNPAHLSKLSSTLRANPTTNSQWKKNVKRKNQVAPSGMWMVWLSHKIFPFLFSLHTAENKNTFQENKDDGIEEGGQLPASTINPIPTPLFTLRSCNSIPQNIHLSLFFSKQNFYLQTALTKTLPHSHKKNSDCQVTHPFSLGVTMAKMLLEHEFCTISVIIMNATHIYGNY